MKNLDSFEGKRRTTWYCHGAHNKVSCEHIYFYLALYKENDNIYALGGLCDRCFLGLVNPLPAAAQIQ